MARKSFLGVEIGDSRVKLVETRRDRVTRFAAVDLPDDMVRQGEIVQWEAMADFLKDCVKKGGFSIKKAALVVPDSVAFTRKTRLPAMNASQLEYNLSYEFHDYITEEKEKYYYDYSMVGLVRDDENNVTDMDMLAVAVSKETMLSYMRMFRRAGLKLLTAAPENIALGNLCLGLNPALRETDFALMDLGSIYTKIDIFSKGVYEVTRNLDTGCRAVANVIVDQYGCDPHIAEMYMRDNHDNILASDACRDVYSRIAVDVMRVINYYTFENRDNNLETMYYFGGGANVAALIEEIQGTIQLELKPLSSLAENKWKYPEAIMNAAAATGICWNHA